MLMAERLLPQPNWMHTLLGLSKIISIEISKNRITGIAIPIAARPLPVTLPALIPIWTRLIIPKITADIIAPKWIIASILLASIAAKSKAKKLRTADINEAIASPLVLTFTLSASEETGFNAQLQEPQN